jgi:hypothetical protein
MAVIIRPDKVSLYNISSQSDEPESLTIDTTCKHWLCTPNREALISLYHVAPAARTQGDGQWMMDAFALEECGMEQPLFHTLLTQHPVFELPSQVCVFLLEITCSRNLALSDYRNSARIFKHASTSVVPHM